MLAQSFGTGFFRVVVMDMGNDTTFPRLFFTVSNGVVDDVDVLRAEVLADNRRNLVVVDRGNFFRVFEITHARCVAQQCKAVAVQIKSFIGGASVMNPHRPGFKGTLSNTGRSIFLRDKGWLFCALRHESHIRLERGHHLFPKFRTFHGRRYR